MSRVLAVCLLASLPLGALAAPGPKSKVAPVAKTTAADKQAFDQTYEFVFLQAGQAYLKDEGLPDAAALAPFLADLKEPESAKATVKKDLLAESIANAQCVQGGPGTISSDVYKLMVDQVAADLQVGVIVELNFLPNGRAGRSLDAAEKVLVKACQGEARNQAYDRRGFYQACLGRRQAEAVYLAPGRTAAPPGPVKRAQSCVRVLDAVAAGRSRLSVDLSQDITSKLERTKAELLAAAPTAALSPGLAMAGGGSSSSVIKKGAALFSRTAVTGVLSRKSDLAAVTPPLGSADLGAGADLAGVVKADEIGFTGYCYSYVKSALQKVGIVDKKDIAAAGDGAHAKLFSEFVEKNPALLKRKLLRLPAPSWPLPIGTIVVWSSGACGFSNASGHIEIITRIKPPQACSDGCQTFQVACLEELAADPGHAAGELPSAQLALDQAQAEYDALKATGLKDKRSVTARQAAYAVLGRKKTALAAVTKRLTPRVAAYVIERPKKP